MTYVAECKEFLATASHNEDPVEEELSVGDAENFDADTKAHVEESIREFLIHVTDQQLILKANNYLTEF